MRNFWKDRVNRMSVWGTVCFVSLILAILLAQVSVWALMFFGVLCVVALFNSFMASASEGSRVTTHEEE